MVLKDTIHSMKRYLEELSHDLEKAALGNKSASQRVRTLTVKFAKLSKVYRKESVAAEKKFGAKAPKRAGKVRRPAKKGVRKKR